MSRRASPTPELPPHAVSGLVQLLRRYQRILEAEGGNIACCAGMLRSRDIVKALKKAGLGPSRRKKT